MPRNRRNKYKKNPLPVIIWATAATGAKVLVTLGVIGGVAGTYMVTRHTMDAFGLLNEVDTEIFDSLASRQDYAALANFYGVLLKLADEKHLYTTYDELKEAYGGASPGSLALPPENPVLANLQAAIYLMMGYLLSGDVTALNQSVEYFNGIKKASLNPTTAAKNITKVISDTYALLLSIPFKDTKSKFRVVNALSKSLSDIGVQVSQLEQQDIDAVVQEEVLMAKCKSEKPFGAILAALSFQKKPICYTDQQWFWLKVAAWGGLFALTGLALRVPLRYASMAGDLLGEATKQLKSKSEDET